MPSKRCKLNSAAQRRKMVREKTSGNFVPISGELAKTWTLATALSR
jgi:hypothetical protein